MKIEIRPEIGISMFNCAAVKKWKRSVAWFASYGVKRIADAERNLRKTDLCSCKRQLESRQRQLEKTAVVKAGAYIVSIDRKTTV